MADIGICGFEEAKIEPGSPSGTKPGQIGRSCSHRPKKLELNRKALRCVMDITARQCDETVIFTACSDAPHKRSLLEKVIQRTRCRAGGSI